MLAPMLTVTWRSRASSQNGACIASRILRATALTSSGRARSVASTANASAPHRAPQPVGDHAKQRVARAVAVAFVDELESVQVYDEQRRWAARALRVRDSLKRAIPEERAVRQAGKRIVICKILQALLVRLAVAYVARDGGEKPYRPVRPLVGGDHLGYRDLGSIGPEQGRFAVPQAVALGGPPPFPFDPLARPLRVYVDSRFADVSRFRRSGELSSRGVHVDDLPGRFGDADVVARRLQDLHQPRAL